MCVWWKQLLFSLCKGIVLFAQWLQGFGCADTDVDKVLHLFLLPNAVFFFHLLYSCAINIFTSLQEAFKWSVNFLSCLSGNGEEEANRGGLQSGLVRAEEEASLWWTRLWGNRCLFTEMFTLVTAHWQLTSSEEKFLGAGDNFLCYLHRKDQTVSSMRKSSLMLSKLPWTNKTRLKSRCWSLNVAVCFLLRFICLFCLFVCFCDWR